MGTQVVNIACDGLEESFVLDSRDLARVALSKLNQELVDSLRHKLTKVNLVLNRIALIYQRLERAKVSLNEAVVDLLGLGLSAFVLLVDLFNALLEEFKLLFDKLLIIRKEKIFRQNVLLLVLLLAAFISFDTSGRLGLDVTLEIEMEVFTLEESDVLIPLLHVGFNVYLEEGVPKFDLTGLGCVAKVLSFGELYKHFVVFLGHRCDTAGLQLINEVQVVVRDRSLNQVIERFLFLSLVFASKKVVLEGASFIVGKDLLH